MLLEILLSVLGQWSRDVIGWFTNNPLNLILVYGTWMLLWWAGKFQLQRNISFLEEKSLSLARESISKGEKINVQIIYETVYQSWKQNIRHLAWFIPHQSELWPIPARFDVIKSRINFSPQWVVEILKKNNLLDNQT